MGLPKKVKKDIQLVPDKQLLSRREELLEYIQKNGTYLPKSVLHPDLDRGMLDFVKDNLLITVEGQKISFVDIMLSTQNWSQYTETWNFMNEDLNVEPPLITVVRNPEMKYGSNPALQYTIPNRREFHYFTVPTWDGQRKGADIYQIPQPVPIDITYSIKILTNRLNDLNNFNRVMLQKFSSRQAYAFIKGQYVPIIMSSMSDESQIGVDSRKYFLQSYELIMLGYLIDEDEFKVKPALSRVVHLYETNVDKIQVKKPEVKPNINPELTINFDSNTTIHEEQIRFDGVLELYSSDNVESFDVFINGLYFGSDIVKINVSDSDVVRFVINKFENKESKMYFKISLDSWELIDYNNKCLFGMTVELINESCDFNMTVEFIN